MIKIKNRYCYAVTLILCGTLFLTGLTGCKSRENIRTEVEERYR